MSTDGSCWHTISGRPVSVSVVTRVSLRCDLSQTRYSSVTGAPRAKLPRSYPLAFLATAEASAVRIDIVRRQFVPVDAMRLVCFAFCSAHRLHTERRHGWGQPATNVFALGNKLQMGEIDACTIAAEMIDLHAIRYRAIDQFPGQSMDKDCLSNTQFRSVLTADSDLPVTVQNHPAIPDQATSARRQDRALIEFPDSIGDR